MGVWGHCLLVKDVLKFPDRPEGTVHFLPSLKVTGSLPAKVLVSLPGFKYKTQSAATPQAT